MQTIHAESRPDKLRADLLDLVRFPSITGSEDENRIARHIHKKLQGLSYFQDNPAYLRLIDSRLPDIPRPLLAVFALVKADSPTQKTVLLISHFDVVDVQNFGSLEPLAFDPEKLTEKLAGRQLSPEVSRDLHSGGYLFGRGVMDMKLGLALEMDILAEFSRDRALFDVNIALLAVGDEENNNGGMRQGVRFLHRAARELGIDIACVVDTEPSDAGRPGASEQMIFLGTTGKLLPFFYIQGFGSHAGSYYQGLSASLAASYLHTLIEANPDLVDFDQGEITPPPLALGLELRHREYSVTLPDKTATYFNYFALRKTPSQIIEEMKAMAEEAVLRTKAHLSRSYLQMKARGYSGPESRIQVPVLEYARLYESIRSFFPGDLDREMAECAQDLPQDLDVREKGFCLVERLLALRQEETPLIVTGLLPPFLPPRTSLGGSPKETALHKAAGKLKDYSRQTHATRLESAVYFGGICDLSYAGCDFAPGELDFVARNIPGWGEIYSIPFEEITALDAPVINIGPRGRDAHKMTERLETDYAFRILPDLLRFFIRQFE